MPVRDSRAFVSGYKIFLSIVRSDDSGKSLFIIDSGSTYYKCHDKLALVYTSLMMVMESYGPCS